MLPFAWELRDFMPNHRAFSAFQKAVTQQQAYLFAISKKLIWLMALTMDCFQSYFTEAQIFLEVLVSDVLEGDSQVITHSAKARCKALF